MIKLSKEVELPQAYLDKHGELPMVELVSLLLED